MNLKPKEKSAILAGQFPSLVRPERDFEEGEEFVLKASKGLGSKSVPEVSIRITGHARHKNGSWEAIYCVKDDRGVYVAQGVGYTRSPERALDKTAPVLDPDVIEGYAKEGWVKTRLARAEHSGTGKLAKEFAAREQKRLEAA